MINLEAEKALLGCLIVDNTLIKQAQIALKVEDFHKPLNQNLYSEILMAYAKHETIDITVLKSCSLEELVDVVNFVPTTANFNMYLNEIVETSFKRQLFKAVETAKNKIQTLDDGIETVKAEVLSIINSVSVPSNDKSSSKLVDIVLDTLNDLEEQYKSGEAIYKKWGFTWLDEKSGGVKPGFTILAARPSVGKTAFALQLGLNVAKQKSKVAIFSLEMPAAQLVHRLFCNNGTISKEYLDKPWLMDDERWRNLAKTSIELSGLDINIFDKYFGIEEILLKIEELNSEQGLDLVIIDYIQLMESSKNFKDSNARVEYISRLLKKYQQKNSLHVIALSQLNRETEKQKFPTLANLRDCGALEQDADNVWFLHPENVEFEESKPEQIDISLILAKQRGAERNIMKKIKFYGKTQKFYEY